MQYKYLILLLFFVVIPLASAECGIEGDTIVGDDIYVYCEGAVVDDYFLQDLPAIIPNYPPTNENEEVIFTSGQANNTPAEDTMQNPELPSSNTQTTSPTSLPETPNNPDQEQEVFSLLTSIGVVFFILLITFLVILNRYHKAERVRHYIHNCQEQGYGDPQIIDTLKKQGYSDRFIKKQYKTLDR